MEERKFENQDPIFIIGAPRSGTTMFLEFLSNHEDLAWISRFYNLHPGIVFLNYINRLYDLPIFGKVMLKLKYNNLFSYPYEPPRPVEPWNFWNNNLSDFRSDRKNDQPIIRNRADISSEEKEKLKNVVNDILRIQGKKRFLSKYTDFPRIKYLKKVFPDAQFIHLVRDGRAVSNSHYNRLETPYFQTWENRHWWLKLMPEKWKEEWENKYRSKISFLAYLWKFLINEIWKESNELSKNEYLELRYKNLVEEPEKAIKKVLDFCNLPYNEGLRIFLETTNFKNMNYKWEENLNNRQKKELEEIIYETKYRRLFDS